MSLRNWFLEKVRLNQNFADFSQEVNICCIEVEPKKAQALHTAHHHVRNQTVCKGLQH